MRSNKFSTEYLPIFFLSLAFISKLFVVMSVTTMACVPCSQQFYKMFFFFLFFRSCSFLSIKYVTWLLRLRLRESISSGASLAPPPGPHRSGLEPPPFCKCTLLDRSWVGFQIKLECSRFFSASCSSLIDFQRIIGAIKIYKFASSFDKILKFIQSLAMSLVKTHLWPGFIFHFILLIQENKNTWFVAF